MGPTPLPSDKPDMPDPPPPPPPPPGEVPRSGSTAVSGLVGRPSLTITLALSSMSTEFVWPDSGVRRTDVDEDVLDL